MAGDFHLLCVWGGTVIWNKFLGLMGCSWVLGSSSPNVLDSWRFCPLEGGKVGLGRHTISYFVDPVEGKKF